MEWNTPRSPSARTITPTIGTIVATRNPIILCRRPRQSGSGRINPSPGC
jgi:hypothetical protein